MAGDARFTRRRRCQLRPDALANLELDRAARRETAAGIETTAVFLVVSGGDFACPGAADLGIEPISA